MVEFAYSEKGANAFYYPTRLAVEKPIAGREDATTAIEQLAEKTGLSWRECGPAGQATPWSEVRKHKEMYYRVWPDKPGPSFAIVFCFEGGADVLLYWPK